jgi:CRP-like cAMP-binding protein
MHRLKEAAMDDVHRVLVDKLREHSALNNEDIATIRSLSYTERELAANEDLIRQGDEPDVSVLVSCGMVARYHLLPNGRRQYLSFHLTGDLPDSQALFVSKMDHAVCALGDARVACIPHKDLKRAFEARPSLAFAIWRETLIDAAIFREAITNNSARDVTTRMAHLFCELFYRARASGLTQDQSLEMPVSLVQLGEALGMGVATVNRTLSRLRSTGFVEFRGGTLTVINWRKLAKLGEFDPGYLHLRKPAVA